MPVLPIGEPLDTSPRNIFAAWMIKDELDSEVDYVGASPEATGSRVEDVESPVKPHNPALNLSTCSPPPSQIQPAARLGIPHPIEIFLLNTTIIDRYSQIKTLPLMPTSWQSIAVHQSSEVPGCSLPDRPHPQHPASFLLESSEVPGLDSCQDRLHPQHPASFPLDGPSQPPYQHSMMVPKFLWPH